jgi:hypothetical protein
MNSSVAIIGSSSVEQLLSQLRKTLVQPVCMSDRCSSSSKTSAVIECTATTAAVKWHIVCYSMAQCLYRQRCMYYMFWRREVQRNFSKPLALLQ